MMQNTRRDFLKSSAALGSMFTLSGIAPIALAAEASGSKVKLGMVTYLWGQSWDIPTIIKNCKTSGIEGVEARVQHKHGIEPTLTASERKEVKRMFDDSPITLVGCGTNQAFHSPDPAELRKQIEGAKSYLKLSHDCGATGVKVKPNDLPKGVPVEKTTAQIARSLNEVGKYAGELGQMVRVEVHGACCVPTIMKQIFDGVDDPNVSICWNCNSQDLGGDGFQANFDMLKGWFGDAAHVRELNVGDYPYQDLISNFVAMDYDGWVLLECRTKPSDLVKAYAEQRKVFDEMVAKAG